MEECILYGMIETRNPDVSYARTLLSSYQEVMNQVNEQPGAVFMVKDDNVWLANHFLRAMSVNEFEAYLLQEVEAGKGTGKWLYDGYCLNATEPGLEELAEELLQPYLDKVEALEGEYQVELKLPQEEQWMAVAALENLTVDEFEEQLRAGLEP